MKIIVANDMQDYVVFMNKSFSLKRETHQEYQEQVSIKGYNYSKETFVKEKFPRFPLRLRKQIINFI